MSPTSLRRRFGLRSRSRMMSVLHTIFCTKNHPPGLDHTLEVRWFFPGTPPTSIENWFSSIGADEESNRSDLYLVGQDPSMNVKLREGKVQTKRRLGARMPIAFSSTVEGIRERWVKWSFYTDSMDLMDDDPTGLWVPVHKERIQLCIDGEDQADLLKSYEAIDPVSTPVESKIELTRVEAKGETAWSICMEAEGRPDGLVGTLDQMGRYLFAQPDAPHLSRQQSFGFVQWIQRLPGAELMSYSDALARNGEMTVADE